MIVGFVVSALLSCIDAVVSLFPSWSLGSTLGNDGTIAFVAELNGIVPIHTAVQLLALTVTVLVAMRVWEVGLWVFHQFWGSD